MKPVSLISMIVLLAAAPPATRAVDAPSTELERVKDATTVLEEMAEMPETSIPPSLIRDAHGIAVIPGVIKVGFVVGGRHGDGILVVRQPNGSWSRPVFMSLTAGSIGWQIGAQSTDIVLVFKTQRSVEGVLSGKYTLGADAAVAAGPVGRQATAGTDTRLQAEIYSYSRSRGAFAGVSLEGSKISIDGGANARFYAREGLTGKEVVESTELETPDAATTFIDRLDALVTDEDGAGDESEE